MSKALEKAAEFSPPELFLLSALAGGAGFGGMRLTNDLYHSLHPIQPPNNSIQLELPNPHKAHRKTLDEPEASMDSSEPVMGSQVPALNKAADDDNMFAPYFAVAAGAPVGFLGIKALYDKYQANQNDAQIHEAKKQYTQQLALAQAQAMQKGASATPNVDKLCEAMAQEMEKSASLVSGLSNALGKVNGATGLKINPSLGSVVRGGALLGSVGGTAEYLHHLSPTDLNGAPPAIPGVDPNEIVGKINALNNPDVTNAANRTVNSWARGGWEDTIDTVSGKSTKAVRDLWKGLAYGGGAGMLGLLLSNHNKKKEREMKGNYPTTVQYAD